MRTRYDRAVDALYIRFAETTVVENEEIRPGIVLDFDADGKVVAIEVTDASEHLAHGTDLATLTAA